MCFICYANSRENILCKIDSNFRHNLNDKIVIDSQRNETQHQADIKY